MSCMSPNTKLWVEHFSNESIAISPVWHRTSQAGMGLARYCLHRLFVFESLPSLNYKEKTNQRPLHALLPLNMKTVRYWGLTQLKLAWMMPCLNREPTSLLCLPGVSTGMLSRLGAGPTSPTKTRWNARTHVTKSSHLKSC